MTAEDIASEILVEASGVYARAHVTWASDESLRVARPIEAHGLVIGAVERANQLERIELLVATGRVVQQHFVLFTNREFPKNKLLVIKDDVYLSFSSLLLSVGTEFYGVNLAREIESMHDTLALRIA